jgi:hypothetical protein
MQMIPMRHALTGWPGTWALRGFEVARHEPPAPAKIIGPSQMLVELRLPQDEPLLARRPVSAIVRGVKPEDSPWFQLRMSRSLTREPPKYLKYRKELFLIAQGTYLALSG